MRQLIALMIIAFCGLAHGEQYTCTSKQTSGFSFEKASKQWRPRTFQSIDSFMVAPSKGSPNMAVMHVNDVAPIWVTCKGFDKYGYLDCGDYFRMNKISLRFVHSSLSSFYNVIPKINGITDATADDLWVSIGECKKVQE